MISLKRFDTFEIAPNKLKNLFSQLLRSLYFKPDSFLQKCTLTLTLEKAEKKREKMRKKSFKRKVTISAQPLCVNIEK